MERNLATIFIPEGVTFPNLSWSATLYVCHRYLHYYQRYHGHETALKYAAAQRAQAEARMVEQQEAQKASWMDVQFLKQAAEQVSGPGMWW